MAISQVTYTMRYMRLGDVQQVVFIDENSFSIPWSASTYTREVMQSDYSHMLVITRREKIPAQNQWQALWWRIAGHHDEHQTVLAYGGVWLFGTEAHISTIASHPRYRGHGWGELTLLGMLRRVIRLNATEIVLEVRVSNTKAQTLYKKYGFRVETIKEGYYYNNGEDAYYMRLDLTDELAQQRIEKRYQVYNDQYPLIDDFT